MKVITSKQGRDLFNALSKGESVDPRAFLSELSHIPEPIAELSHLEDGGIRLLETYGDGISKGQDSKFEGEVGILLHRTLQNRLDLVSLRDFWIRLSLLDLVDLVLLRHPGGRGGARLAAADNFALGTPRNGFLFRAWLRADIGYDPTMGDPYYIARLGDDVDFWRSHILRVDYGGCRVFGRTFIRFVMDSEAPYYRALERQEMRALAKTVNRRYNTIPLNVLSEDESVELLNKLCERL
jgi:hypothetical protein